MYKGAFYDTPVDDAEIIAVIDRVRLCQEFPGWTLDYVDSLDRWQRAEIWGVIEGQRKIAKERNSQ